MSKKQKLHGIDGFEIYYSSIFGGRWERLKSALLKESKQIAYNKNMIKDYYLDYASIQAALSLPKLNSGKVLDMCAAPGGKTLVILNSMGDDVEITANEISAARRNRLLKVLSEHLTEDRRDKIKVTGFDACKFSQYQKNYYDRILLDAPCSSERHLLQNVKHLKMWTESRIKILAQRQWALLSSAFLSLKPEGVLVYSTCALTTLENDCVIAKLISKYQSSVLIQNIRTPLLAEKTEYGYMFLPDCAEGSGPMYFSIIKKTS